MEDDDRLLSEIGLEFGNESQNRFVLTDHDQLEDIDRAECIIRIPKDMKVYPLTVEKNETVGLLYKQILQMCQSDGFSTDYFVLTFNSYTIETGELVKVCLVI